jgi:alpha-L-fucosidase
MTICSLLEPVFPQEATSETSSTPGKKEIPEKMQWFVDAKLGIFIHWGIYAVEGTSESWAFFNNEVSYEDYMKQAAG